MSKINYISLLIADDHPLMRSGLEKELKALGYYITASVENGVEALRNILTSEPDVAILDIEMPLMTGFEVVEKIKNHSELNTKFILISYHKKKSYLLKANSLGVNGYLLKDDTTETIDSCIRKVYNGENYYSNAFEDNAKNIIQHEIQKIHHLTPSERTILRLLARKFSSAEIAQELNVSTRTIEKHRSNIINKLELKNDSTSLINWTKENQEIIKNL